MNLYLNGPIRRRRARLKLIAAALCLLALAVRPGQTAHAQSDNGSGDGVIVYVVQFGDSVESIARAYGITPETLRAFNNFDPYEDIFVGEHLIVPVSREALTPASADTFTVAIGDSIDSLALAMGVTPVDLARLNHLVNPALIAAGQTLTLPASHADAPSGLLRVGPDRSFVQTAYFSDIGLPVLMLSNAISNPLTVPSGRLLVASGASSTEDPLPVPWQSVTFHPLPLEAGRSGALVVETSLPGTLRFTFLSRDWPVEFDGTRYVVLIGVDRLTNPGYYPYSLTFEDMTGVVATRSGRLLVADGGYTSENIEIDPALAEILDDSALTRAEAAQVAGYMQEVSPDRLWDGLFRTPAAGVMTSAFGTLRSYNGKGYHTYHGGADIGAPLGTPIIAPAAGVVMETVTLDVRGNATIIDHGWGVYTGYWHQSAIYVQPGDVVEAGQEIGLVGSTGLSNAAHLHWELWVSGVEVDPMQWLREEFP